MNCIHNKDEQEHCEQCNCEKPQHTPTEWYTTKDQRGEGYHIQSAVTNEDNYVCLVDKREDAEFIVTACNNHVALVEALKEVQKAFSSYEITFPAKYAYLANTQIKQALAKAEGN